MRKLIFILLLVPFVLNGQNIKKIGYRINSRDRGRINEAIVQTNKNVDSLTAHVAAINLNIAAISALQDSGAIHLDTIQELRTDVNAYQTVLDTDSIITGAMVYSDTYWDDLRVPLSNTRINPALSEPDFEDAGTGFYAWGFDADSDSANVLHFMAQLPHSYKVGTDIESHIHWTPPTTNTGVVRWKLTYFTGAINGTISSAAYLWINDAGDGTAHKHQLTDFGTIDGTSLGISSMIIGYVSRLGDHPDDTYTGSAYGLELDFHYQIDTPGSEEEYTKY